MRNGWRTEIFVWRLDRRLRRDVPYARRTAIRREVRANLRESAQDCGEAEAIRRLGDLGALAAGYREAAGRGELPFRPDSGVRAAVVVTLLLLVVDLIRIPTFSMVETFDPHTGKQSWHWAIRRIGSFGGDIQAQTLFEGTIYGTTFLLCAVVAFLIWSRAWRLPRNHDRTRHDLASTRPR